MKHFWILLFLICLGGCGGEITKTLTTSLTPQTSTPVSPQFTKKPNFDGVDVSTELHIERLCRDKKDVGVLPYWNCLGKELLLLDNTTQPDMSVVEVSTELHIERLCRDKKDDGVLPYWNCLREELNKIGVTPPEIPISTKQIVQSTLTSTQETQSTIKEPVDEETVFTSKPDMSGLSELDTLIIDSNCEWYKGFGIQSYWRCLDEQIKESKTVNLSVLETLRDKVNKETRDIILNYCESFVRFGIGSYYNCLTEQVESIGIK